MLQRGNAVGLVAETNLNVFPNCWVQERLREKFTLLLLHFIAADE